MRATVFRGPKPPLGVGLEYEAGQIGNRAVNFVNLVLPKGDRLRIERIERLDPADLSRAGKVERDQHPHAPFAELGRNAGDFRQQLWGDDPHIGVHVIDRAPVDTHEAMSRA